MTDVAAFDQYKPDSSLKTEEESEEHKGERQKMTVEEGRWIQPIGVQPCVPLKFASNARRDISEKKRPTGGFEGFSEETVVHVSLTSSLAQWTACCWSVVQLGRDQGWKMVLWRIVAIGKVGRSMHNRVSGTDGSLDGF